MPTQFVRCAIDTPIDRLFDYTLPPNTKHDVAPGSRVWVSFGRRETLGLVVECPTSSEHPEHQLKPIIGVLDPTPLIDVDLLSLAQNCVDYYHQPPGELISLLLPAALRKHAPGIAPTTLIRAWRISDTGNDEAFKNVKGAARKRAAELILANRHGITAEQLSVLGNSWRPQIKYFVANGWIEPLYQSLVPAAANSIAPQLTDEQQAAVNIITEKLANGFACYLLDGVTGSGKTEVYLNLTKQILEQGKSVLVLVPEIGLTPQLAERFARRFSEPVATLHSGMADGERLRAWHAARNGVTSIIVGTRSALFTPLPRLGMIIVDEEHDLSFKQQEGIRFSARDMAVLRAQQANIPIVLGSATPSLESLYNAARGRYQHLRLTRRTGNAKPPTIELLDVRGKRLGQGLSRSLITAIDETLAAGEQTLLFLNRRGFAPALICQDCGWVCPCPRCDAKLTVHRHDNMLRCHHCGFQRRLLDICPECNNADLRPLGLGTERIDAVLRAQFPTARIARIDRDTTRRKGALADVLEQAHAKEIDILLGTQMLAKGHDLPQLTLVGIIDGDQGLYNVDFRAAERMAQLVVQVAGRAGRGDKPGRVMIQTRTPDHPLLHCLLNGGYPAFAKQALEERSAADLPPFCFLALLRAEANNAPDCQAFMAQVKALLKNQRDVLVLGPTPAPMERREGRNRLQLLLQSRSRQALQQVLADYLPQLHALKPPRSLRWHLDVDPQELS